MAVGTKGIGRLGETIVACKWREGSRAGVRECEEARDDVSEQPMHSHSPRSLVSSLKETVETFTRKVLRLTA